MTAAARAYPSAQRAGAFGLGGPGLRPSHRVLNHRVVPAAYGLKANRMLYKFDVEKPESNLF